MSGTRSLRLGGHSAALEMAQATLLHEMCYSCLGCFMSTVSMTILLLALPPDRARGHPGRVGDLR